MTTIALVCTLMGLLACTSLLWACFLRLGLRWAGVANVTARGVALTTLLNVVLQLLVLLVVYLVRKFVSEPSLIVELAAIAAHVGLVWWLVMRVFQASLGQAIKAWLVTLATAIVMLPLPILVIRPFLFEAYVSPTNAMAPTLLGNHWQFTCQQCGSPAYCSPMEDYGGGYVGYTKMPIICRDNFHITQRTESGSAVLGSDRFLVAKFLRPRRWDIVVFRYPENPSQRYVMRLIGLPGEVITIEDGQVFADGRRLAPPESLRGIEYRFDGPRHRPYWGTLESPGQLDDDEYFVLGDFSAQAKDSRWWRDGAPDHHPYAVPESHLESVVTHRYWPPSRWRTFR